jgi:hypothetical protein
VVWNGYGVSKLTGDNQGVNPLTYKNQLILYPNPFQDVLQINLPGNTGILEIFDISGKSLILKEIQGNKISIDVSGLDHGIYFVKVLSDNQILTGKFVKY